MTVMPLGKNEQKMSQSITSYVYYFPTKIHVSCRLCHFPLESTKHNETGLVLHGGFVTLQGFLCANVYWLYK